MTRTPFKILVIEDNETLREGMVQILSGEGYTLRQAVDGTAGTKLLEEKPDLVITDYKMAGVSGMQILEQCRNRFPEIPVIMITAYGTIELAVEAMKAGAWDFLPKPFSREELLLRISRAIEALEARRQTRRLQAENEYLRLEVESCFNYGEIVGGSPRMKAIYRTIEKVAGQDTSVMIYGESGTGKELVARAIHFQSPRKDKPFVRVNCGALAEGILESELFGHEKGAFTGALKQKRGRFELAHKGTLFLDEIGDIPLSTQLRLLRVLQEKEFERVGGEETVRVDVRVIAATHRDLMDEVKEGRFREDLYYRLHILPISIPPLRERKEDIPQLANHFLRKLCDDMKRKPIQLTDEGLEILTAYNWPGNVRELENVLERAVVLAESSRIDGASLSFMLSRPEGTNLAGQSLNLDKAAADLEARMIREALDATRGIKTRAARLLGVSESTLYYKMQKHGIHAPE
ncbi:MAG TPA: sigma-54-dependent Fis family transcriptional regulator [bacterium]|nr:sigma-54-dependent Fis family transcriptional regulator [bacterium]